MNRPVGLYIIISNESWICQVQDSGDLVAAIRFGLIPNFEISFRIASLPNVRIDVPRISGKNLHGHVNTFWLSHKIGHHQNLALLAIPTGGLDFGGNQDVVVD
jgi:hypothetical protein